MARDLLVLDRFYPEQQGAFFSRRLNWHLRRRARQ